MSIRFESFHGSISDDQWIQDFNKWHIFDNDWGNEVMHDGIPCDQIPTAETIMTFDTEAEAEAKVEELTIEAEGEWE